jgi:hypothetical protein
LTPQQIRQQLDPAKFQLTLNESLPGFSKLTALLEKNNIPFETTHAKQQFALTILLMGFGPSCRFQDVYYLAMLFKEFGLKSVYPLNTRIPVIQLGTYLHKFPRKSWADFTLGEPMPIDAFLLIDPALSTKDVIDTEFENVFLKADENEADRDKLNDVDEYEGFDESTEDRMDDAFEEE